MSVSNKRIILIAGACTLFVLLYFAPKVLAKKTEKIGPDSNNSANALNSNLDVYLNTAIKALNEKQTAVYQKLYNSKNADSLVVFWDRLKRSDLSAFFAEVKAKEKGNEANWLSAGKKYFNSTQFCEDRSELPVLFQCALRCFNQTLKLNAQQTEAKILKASCLVEGAGNPMDGIAILKEVEKTDSNNVQLQLTFAFFSVKSGQLDKAVERFSKVLRADSNYVEAYLHLADVYEQQHKPEKTIDMLTRYSAKTDDPTVKTEIAKYIQQLKTSINK